MVSELVQVNGRPEAVGAVCFYIAACQSSRYFERLQHYRFGTCINEQWCRGSDSHLGSLRCLSTCETVTLGHEIGERAIELGRCLEKVLQRHGIAGASPVALGRSAGMSDSMVRGDQVRPG